MHPSCRYNKCSFWCEVQTTGTGEPSVRPNINNCELQETQWYRREPRENGTSEDPDTTIIGSRDGCVFLVSTVVTVGCTLELLSLGIGPNREHNISSWEMDYVLRLYDWKGTFLRQLQYTVRTLEGTATLPKPADEYEALKRFIFNCFLNTLNLNLAWLKLSTLFMN